MKGGEVRTCGESWGRGEGLPGPGWEEPQKNASGWGWGPTWGRGSKAGDDVGALKLLVVAKAACIHDHGVPRASQVQLGRQRGGE